MATGKPFVHYTSENLSKTLEDWLSNDPLDARD
jgi:hypothetical protein